MGGRMRDVGVWKIGRFSGIVAGSAFVLSGCIACIEVSPASALTLPSLGIVPVLVSDTTTTLKTVVGLPQKATPPSAPISAASPITSSPTVSQPAATAAKSSAPTTPTPSPSSVSASSVQQPAVATSGYEGEAFDTHLMQPFILASAVRWPYAAGLMMNTGSQPIATHTALIEATPQGWRIGGVLWYWWVGLLGLIAVAIHERARFVPRRHMLHGV